MVMLTHQQLSSLCCLVYNYSCALLIRKIQIPLRKTNPLTVTVDSYFGEQLLSYVEY